MRIGNPGLGPVFLIEHRNPCPVGKVKVQRVCPLNDSVLLQGRVVPTTIIQGVTYKPISKIITDPMALPVSYYMGTEVSIPDIGKPNWSRR